MSASQLIVVDLGNSRMKWGLCGPDRVEALAALPLFDLEPWRPQLEAWSDGRARRWVIAAANPLALERFAAWLEVNDEPFRVLREARDFPVQTAVDHPEQVGKDRLANATAYVHAFGKERQPALLVSAGSAVTADYVDEAGTFRGGAILPGLGMMAKALHHWTGRLPLVEAPAAPPARVGTNTEAAMQLGVAAAAIGAVRELEGLVRRQFQKEPRLFLTGGDAPLLRHAFPQATAWPEMTLEGVRIAAQSPAR